MSNLTLEKKFAHRKFQAHLANINDLNAVKQLCEDLHLLYLNQQTLFSELAKQDFSNGQNSGIEPTALK